MSLCKHNSSFIALHRISLSSLLSLNFDPKWLRNKKITKHSCFENCFVCLMWISYNLKMVEFHTNLLPKSGLRLHEVERIQNASKLLWHKAKAIKDHISRSFWDLDVVLHAQFEFSSIPMHFSFNLVKPQFLS